MDKFVVIGAGQAGGRAVEAMRGAGFQGQIDLIGAESAPPYERPQLSKELLLDPNASLAPQFPADFFAANGINLRAGMSATAIDRDKRVVQLSDGAALPYDKLLLTTGAKTRDLNIPGRDVPNILTLRTAGDAHAITAQLGLARNIVVIGGGFIGLEVAAAAVQRGCRVTLLEFADRLMGRAVPETVSRIFASLHRDKGVDIRLETAAACFEGEKAVTTVVTMDDDRIAADLVVIGVGIEPDTALATAAGLDCGNGIVVDEFCRTSDLNIYAAGDVANQYNTTVGRRLRLESWQNAQNQAIAAAQNMCGANTPFAEVPWFWSDQYDVNLQMCGAPEAWDNTVMRGGITARDGILFQYDGDQLTGALSVNRPRDMRFVKRIMDRGLSPAASDISDENIAVRELLKA